MSVVNDLVGDGFIGVGWPRIWRPCEGFWDAFEEAGSLNESINIVDNVDSALIVAERCGRGLPPALTRTFIYDSISKLDDFAREHHGCVGKAMDHIYDEPPGFPRRALEATNPLGGE